MLLSSSITHNTPQPFKLQDAARTCLSLSWFSTQYWLKRSYGKMLKSSWFPPGCLSRKVPERSVCSVLVNVTTATGQMEGVYNFGDFGLSFQDALKAFQMYPHSYALSHMLHHDYFEQYIIVKTFCFHCIMHELVIFILRIVLISTSSGRLGSMLCFEAAAVMRKGPAPWTRDAGTPPLQDVGTVRAAGLPLLCDLLLSPGKLHNCHLPLSILGFVSWYSVN